MSRRLFVALAVVSLSLGSGAVSEVRAQGADGVRRLAVTPSFAADAVVLPVVLEAEQLPTLTRPTSLPRVSNRPSALMMSLYASTAALQMLDVHSTITALDNGAVEANPLMKNVAGNKAAFVALKAGVAVTTILATRNMAKRNKVAAMATLIAINSAYAFVVSHNYKVARSQ
jgi:hypothetical protein